MESTDRHPSLAPARDAAGRLRLAARSVAAVYAGIGPGWRLAFGLTIALRVGLELVGLISIRIQPITFVAGMYRQYILPGRSLGVLAISLWQRWDALWFQRIVQQGYQSTDYTLHFQPLYPLASRLATPLLGGRVALAMLAVATAAFFVGLGLLYGLVASEVSPEVARITVLLMALSPVSFLFLAPYSDSLYLALTVGSLYLARRARPGLAGVVGLLAAATRTVGGLLVIPLVYENVRQARRAGRPLLPALAAGVLPAVGVALVSAYGRFLVGQQRNLFQLEGLWRIRYAAPWTVLPASFAWVQQHNDPIETMNLVALVLAAILTLVGLKRLPFVYFLYAAPALLLFSVRLETSPLAANTRYVLVLFPWLVVAARLLAGRRQLTTGVLVVGVMLQALLFQAYVHFVYVA